MRVEKAIEQKKRKLMLFLTGIALVLVAIGGTYAWWTASVETKQKVSMGKLSLEANFAEIQDTVNYEPGLSVDIDGIIKNTGSIETIAKVTNSSSIKFAYADDGMTPILPENQTFVKDTEGAIQVAFGPGNDTDVYWFKDQQNNVYALFEVGGIIDTTVTADLNGDVMGNKYQEAEIELGAKLQATQVLDGAIQAEFGIAIGDLQDYHSGSGRSAGATKGEQRLAELAQRNQTK